MALVDGNDAFPLSDETVLAALITSGIATSSLGHPEIATVSIKIPEFHYVWNTMCGTE